MSNWKAQITKRQKQTKNGSLLYIFLIALLHCTKEKTHQRVSAVNRIATRTFRDKQQQQQQQQQGWFFLLTLF